MKKPWYLDSGYSRHMTSDKSLFQELDGNQSGNVTFGDNSIGVIQGIGTIGNTSQFQILFVEGLMHDLLSISLLCDKGLRYALILMHAISLIQVPTKSYTNKKA